MALALSLPSDVAAGTLPPAPKKAYRFQRIDGVNAQFTECWGINDRGVVSLFWSDGQKLHAATWQNGQLTEILPPNGEDPASFDINNKGVIVATLQTAGGQSLPAVYKTKEKSWSLLPDRGGLTSIATGITEQGAVLGRTYSADFSTSSGFVYFNGKYTDFNFPNAVFSDVRSINSAGWMVGNYFLDPTGGSHGFLRVRNELRTVDVAGTDSTSFYCINDEGVAVGEYNIFSEQPDHFSHGLIMHLGNDHCKSGQAYTIEFPGDSINTLITGINNRGVIVGVYWGTVDGVMGEHGFIATPSEDQD